MSHVDHIRSYYESLNSGDAEAVAAHFTEDAVHYYTRLGPHEGAETIGGYAAFAVANIEGRWHLENAIEGGRPGRDRVDDDLAPPGDRRGAPRPRRRVVPDPRRQDRRGPRLPPRRQEEPAGRPARLRPRGPRATRCSRASRPQRRRGDPEGRRGDLTDCAPASCRVAWRAPRRWSCRRAAGCRTSASPLRAIWAPWCRESLRRRSPRWRRPGR